MRLLHAFTAAAQGSAAAMVIVLGSALYLLPAQTTVADHERRVLHVMGLAYRIDGRSAVSWWSSASSLQHLAAYARGTADLVVGEGTQPVRTAVVSGDFFSVFSVRPVSGRLLEAADEDNQPIGAAVISHSLWKRERNDATPVGREIRLGHGRYRVVGILPRGFDYPPRTDIWVSGVVAGLVHRSLRLEANDGLLAGPSGGWVARLSDGASAADAEAELYRLQRTLNARSPKPRFGDTIRLQTPNQVMAQTIKPSLLRGLLGALVMLVVAIAAAAVLWSIRGPAIGQSVTDRGWPLWMVGVGNVFATSVVLAVVFFDGIPAPLTLPPMPVLTAIALAAVASTTMAMRASRRLGSYVLTRTIVRVRAAQAGL